MLHDGVAAGGDRARAANYVSAVGADGGAVLLRDEQTGETFPFSAKIVVNTSGPWTDLTNDALGVPTHFMGGTKGSHIVLDSPELLDATRGNEIFFEHSDGRIVLIYPLKGRVMVGTTDIDADPRTPSVCTDDEIEYFFELISHVFPDITVDRSQIVYTFSGIRPLPRHDDMAPGFVSRDYRIEEGTLGGVPMLSLVGGKWTTFRALAENLGGKVLEHLGVSRTVDTTTLAIGGGRDYPRTQRARATWVADNAQGHSAALTDRMLERYGTRAVDVLAAIPVGAEDLPDLPGYYAAELAHLAATEQVVTLADLLFRRTSLAFVGGLDRAGLVALADAVAPALGWDQAEAERQVESVVAQLRESHRVDIETRHLAPAH